MAFDVSVVVVSDYKAGEDKSWQDIRSTLRALRDQDYAGSVQCLLIEEERFANEIPPDLKDIYPGLKIVLSRNRSSYELGNDGVAAAEADLAVLLDADCRPISTWLSSFMAASAANPDAAVISGRTRYPGNGLAERCLALLSRGYVDSGNRGRTEHISNNNAGYRRQAFLAHPLPTNAGVYASRLQAEAMTRAGLKLYFEPGMAVTHDYEGWDMERDVRCYTGWGIVKVRQVDPQLPYAWLLRMGIAGIPLMVLGRFMQSLKLCTVRYAPYGIRPWEVPCAWALAAYAHALEVPGMVRALRGQPVGETVYR